MGLERLQQLLKLDCGEYVGAFGVGCIFVDGEDNVKLNLWDIMKGKRHIFCESLSYESTSRHEIAPEVLDDPSNRTEKSLVFTVARLIRKYVPRSALTDQQDNVIEVNSSIDPTKRTSASEF